MRVFLLCVCLTGCGGMLQQADKNFELSLIVTPTEHGCRVEWNGKEVTAEGSREVQLQR